MPSPGASSPGSPRNLLMTKPLTRAWSATQQGDGPEQGREHAAPVDVADHDDRQPGRRASPMLAMSVSRRLISAGLPAPSQMTTS